MLRGWRPGRPGVVETLGFGDPASDCEVTA